MRVQTNQPHPTPGFEIISAMGGLMAVAYARGRNASVIALLEPASALVFAAIVLSQPIYVKCAGGRRADSAGCADGQ